jgi:hypothetical protein
MIYFIQEYFSGVNILSKNGYTKYFKNFTDADDFLNSLGKLNNEDSFYIVEEDKEGNQKPVEY